MSLTGPNSTERTVEFNQELLAMQCEVDAIIGEALECYDEGAIAEEELAAVGLVLELSNPATVERRAALQAGTLADACIGKPHSVRSTAV